MVHPSDCPRRALVRASIREIPDFPKPGILFQDITTLLLDPVAFQTCIDLLLERVRGHQLDAVCAFESRGFPFGAPLALALGLPLVLLRKPKKLPGAVLSESYALEYGTDTMEMHVGALKEGQRVLLVDDLVATGGTLAAGARLVARAGAVAVEAVCIIELPELKGREKLGDGLPLFALLDVEGA